MTADLLVIIPTKGRPHLIPRLLDAIFGTAQAQVDVVLVVCEGEVDDYWPAIQRGILSNQNVAILGVPDDLDYPRKLNKAADELAYTYRYLALFNDDHVPETPGWDVTMKTSLSDDAFGIAYGPDGVWANGEIPSAPVITASMHAALGWVALPGLHHILVDNVWLELARATDTIHFLPEVMIRHHHRTNGLAPDDNTYRSTGDDKVHEAEDSQRFWGWLGSPEMGEQVAALKALEAPNA